MDQRHQHLAEIAYRRWESRGRPEGSAVADWNAAEHELDNGVVPASSSSGSAPGLDGALMDSFPASDPPASHLPDVPPSNAEDKWIAANGDRFVDVGDLKSAK